MIEILSLRIVMTRSIIGRLVFYLQAGNIFRALIPYSNIFVRNYIMLMKYIISFISWCNHIAKILSKNPVEKNELSK